VTLLATTAACGGGERQAPVGLESAVVERTDLVSTVAATGTVEPIRVIDVKSQASGEILEVAVELGDNVEQGALLVRIDPRDVQNAFDQAEADLQVARAGAQVAERQFDRVQELHRSQVVTDEELENAILQNANAQAELVKARTNLQLARERLNDVVVRAPIGGTVVERSIEEGQIVTSTREVSGGTTLLRMADLAEVQVRTLVDETDVGSVATDLPATIRVEAFPEREFAGRVLKVEPQAVVEQNVTMFAVLVRIRNDGDLLKPGMNADVEMVTGRRDDVLALPNGAIKSVEEARPLAEVLGLELPGATGSDGAAAQGRPQAGTARAAPSGAAPGRDGPALVARRIDAAANAGDTGLRRAAYVFRYDEEGRLELHPVTIGLSTWERTEVVTGLEEGASVVLVPQALIQQSEMLDRVRERSGVPGVRRQEGS
jgi:HlyD family secretion protein